MLFRRRHPPGLRERIRVALWPRRSWSRSTKYTVKRLTRLGGTPHAIAIGCAAGVLVSFTPFMGLHFIMAGIIAWLLRGSIIASAFGTFIGNPLTFPFIWVASYQLGNWLLGGEATLDSSALMEKLGQLSDSIFHASWSAFWQMMQILWPIVLEPMTIGGLPIGLAASAISYYLVKKAVDSYQMNRRGHAGFQG